MKLLKKLSLFMATTAILLSCSDDDNTTTGNNETPSSPTSSEIARGFYQDVIVDKDMSKFDTYVGKTYIQHAPAYADGVEPLREELQANSTSDNTIEILRVVGEGDYAALHSRWLIGKEEYLYVDIWRIENGKLVEHWDQYQVPPADPKNDNTMHSGPETNVKAFQNLKQNKERAIAVLKTFDNLDDLSAVENYVSDDTYIQHNPTVADGKEAFIGLLNFLKSENYNSKTTIAKAMAQGDMVVVHSKVVDLDAKENATSGVIDIFRFNDKGEIVEHWDIIEVMPKDSKHDNDPFYYPS